MTLPAPDLSAPRRWRIRPRATGAGDQREGRGGGGAVLDGPAASRR